MKININQIQPQGFILEEKVLPVELDLETDIVKFRGPLKIRAEFSKITNAVTVNLALSAVMQMLCSRCLNAFEVDFQKKMQLNYPVEKTDTLLDLGPDIRQEIMLDYPLKPLCKADCRGLCQVCGKNLNEGGCHCAVT